MVLQRILGVTVSLVLLAACTKEAPSQHLNKTLVNNFYSHRNGETYLYSSSTQEVSRHSADARPFSSGDNKRVKLEWTETALQVLETEKDARFQDNRTNDKLLLSIPVEYVDYKCETDQYGECTNKEIEDTDKNWNQKNGFKLKFAEVKSGSLDILPIMISQTIGEDCYQEISSTLLDYQITEEALNFQVQKHYKTKIECLSMDSSLDDAPISAVFHYSLVRLNSVLSKDFKPVAYPRLDERTFGFFSTEKLTLNIDNNRTESGKSTIMNHWNPQRSQIDYYLSDAFDKPENAKIKSLTKQTVASLNEGLAQAGVKFRINLKDPAGKVPGDIRNSMIVLVEDPVASNVIGYGPQTEDPATGEIISARTIMFLGTIKKFIRNTYEEILQAKKEDRKKKLANQDSTPTEEEDPNGGLIIDDSGLNRTFSLKRNRALSLNKELKEKATLVNQSQNQKLSHIFKFKKGSVNVRSPFQMTEQIRQELQDGRHTYINQEYLAMDRQAQLKYMLESKNCALSASDRSISTGISEALKAKISEDSKPWELLSQKEQQAIIDLLLPEVWVPTLIHEMGHNLGLRHNFAASEDSMNYFSHEELSQLNIDREAPFSSVMDYGNDLKALPVLGKYDIAALRFAYARKVETQDGKVIPVTETLQKTIASKETPPLKRYDFCTDENVGVNAFCRRHDEGSSLVEVTKYLIQNYYDSYSLRNLRRGKESMSLYDDPSYAARIRATFLEIRTLFESLERIKHSYQIPDNDNIWKTNAFLKDLKEATLMGGRFFIQVLLSPGLQCAVVNQADPLNIVGFTALNENLSGELTSCSEINLREGLVAVGQIGKFINSMKDPNSENPYLDQIDYRGIWIDKLLAAQFLFNRQIGSPSFDKIADNYFDISDLQEELARAVLAFTMNEVSGPVTLTLLDPAQTQVQLENISYDILDDHIIAKPVSAFTARRLGVPNKERYLQQQIAKIVSQEMVNGRDRESFGAQLSEALKVTRFPRFLAPSNSPSLEDLLNVQLGAETFYASPLNFVASRAISGIHVRTALNPIPREKLEEVIKTRKAGATEIPEGTDEALKAAWDLPLETLEMFKAGEIPSTKQLEQILRYLPSNQDDN